MIAQATSVVELLELVDETWNAEAAAAIEGAGYRYESKALFKVYVVGVLKRFTSRRALHRYLAGHAEVLTACGLARLPDRRTLDRRLGAVAAQAEAQIETLGRLLTVEEVSDGQTVCSDGSAFKARGPRWHQVDKRLGRVPDKLHGLDTDADWIYSRYHGWVYGYKAHLSVTVAPTTVRVVVGATVTGACSEARVLAARLDALPPTTAILLLDAGYDHPYLLSECQWRGLRTFVPLAKKVGKATPPERRQRDAELRSPAGKARFKRRAACIEPFFASLKHTFRLDPLPVRGKAAVSALILLACYAWDLIVLSNFCAHRPLGRVLPILEAL